MGWAKLGAVEALSRVEKIKIIMIRKTIPTFCVLVHPDC